MKDWDEDSPRLRQNLQKAYDLLEEDALSASEPSLEAIRTWHRITMEGLRLPFHSAAGNFRGDPVDRQLARNVRVGLTRGSRFQDVAAETAVFLQAMKDRLDKLEGLLDLAKIPQTDQQIGAVIELAAWAHAEWVRIHPFVNGNGRTARMWANWILIRFGLPPFVSLRPRPGSGYGMASAAAMTGNVKPTIELFGKMFDQWQPPP